MGSSRLNCSTFLFTAGNMMKNMRRSVRKFVSIPLRLQLRSHRAIIGPRKAIRWKLSLHGASIECRIPIAKGEMMTVERVDNHRSAQAKVRWHRRKADGTQTLGIELLDCRGFLGIRQGMMRKPQKAA